MNILFYSIEGFPVPARSDNSIISYIGSYSLSSQTKGIWFHSDEERLVIFREMQVG